jgi:hypothetical protein
MQAHFFFKAITFGQFNQFNQQPYVLKGYDYIVTSMKKVSFRIVGIYCINYKHKWKDN